MSKKVIFKLFFALFFFIIFQPLCEAQELKGFSTPLIAPLYGAPPVKYSDSKFVTIGFKTSPEVLRKLVPQPLVPNPDNLMGVYTSSLNANDYQSGEFSFPGRNYFEVALVIPVRFDKTAGNYCVVMYLDKTVTGVSMGREIWGLPKKGAQITFDEKDRKVSSIVSRFGTPIIKLNFERVQKVEPIPPRPSTPMFSLKYIPSVKKDAPPDVMQLISYVSEWKRKEMWIGNGSVEFGSLPADPLGDIPVLQIVGGRYEVAEGNLPLGDVVYDYLSKEKK
jgi:acetoacetate decarboxylase